MKYGEPDYFTLGQLKTTTLYMQDMRLLISTWKHRRISDTDTMGFDHLEEASPLFFNVTSWLDKLIMHKSLGYILS